VAKKGLQVRHEFKLGGWWFSWGWKTNGLAIGFSIDRYGFSLDLPFIWFGIEF
jgi:hypothetical protein